MAKKIVIVSLIVFLFLLTRAVFYAGEDEINLPSDLEETQIQNPSLSPERLVIPALSIDTRVVPVGITYRGNMATPKKFSEVGWYKYGTAPGERGSAVLAGHVNTNLGLAAVFSDLNKIKVGDEIFLYNLSGKKMRFVVQEKSLYNFNSSAEEVFNQKDDVYLKLITCTGRWLPEHKTHGERLVVTARLVML